MKRFGLIGGTSWHSTVEYYSEINRSINARHNNNTNPRLQIASLNQKEIHDLQRAGDWNSIGKIVIQAAKELQDTGAEGIALCANTPHKLYDSIQSALRIPVLHIADATAVRLDLKGWKQVGLLGTKFTMGEDFITKRLKVVHDVHTVVPAESIQHEIQTRIYDDLSMGSFNEDTKRFFLQITERLADEGAQAVILGCTELPLLLKDTPCCIPLVDSVKCHCEMIVRFILDEENS